jgi:pimeloyl-ACP methyl ester carboxylesterase
MTTSHLGRTVVGCLAVGPVAALLLVAGPLAGAKDFVVTGSLLLAFACSWALLFARSTRWSALPQRWALLPAGFLALAGAGILASAPSGEAIDALGWVWPPVLIGVLIATVVGVRRQLHSRARVWVVYPMLAAYAVSAVGGGYQTISESRDRRTFAARGQLVDVGRRRLHLNCIGTGTPTAVLESGLGELSAYWGWIAPEVARDTRVCTYDRAGRGWSDPAGVRQDGIALAADLHALLERGGVTGPYVLVGHSSGAQYVRIFAGRYPDAVAGMVLLDGQPAEVLERLPHFSLFHRVFRRVFTGFLPLARFGVGRLLYHDDFANLPSPARAMEQFDASSSRAARSLRDEFEELPASLHEAHEFHSLGNLPLVVVTAASGAQAGWLPLQDEMATLSTNSSHRVVPYTHDELITDRAASKVSSRAIRDVIHAVRFTAPLKKSF